jgi:O-antigen biosynthesis protein
MPTCDRRQFVKQALKYYRSQTFSDSELIVMDDGADCVQDLCAGTAAVRYVRLKQRTTTGSKLNIGVELARGAIIQKLDDDDFYSPSFLETALSAFHGAKSAKQDFVVAWDCFLFLPRGSKVVRFSGHGWVGGGTLCFPREFGRQQPFRDVVRHEDDYFFQDHHVEPVRVCAPEMYMVVRHGRNTWTGERADAVDTYISALPVYPKTLRAVVGEHNFEFYSRLASGCR